MTIGVKERDLRGAEWRGTTASSLEAGPSTRTCSYVRRLPRSPNLQSVRTLLWSMISTIVASLLTYGPVVKRTTRPTSTNLHWLVLTSASPIMSIDTGSDGGALAVALADNGLSMFAIATGMKDRNVQLGVG